MDLTKLRVVINLTSTQPQTVVGVTFCCSETEKYPRLRPKLRVELELNPELNKVI